MNVINQFQYGKDIRLFNMNKWLIEKYHDMSMLEYKSLKKFWRNNFRASLGGNIVSFFTTAIIYIYLTYSFIHKGISVGDFLMYSSAIFTFVSAANNFLSISNYVAMQNLYMNDFFEFMSINEQENLFCRNISEIKKMRIDFKNVSFKYPNQENYALKNVSLTINNHEKLAVVGFNGAGKTTFIKLLTRMYEPTEGEILINGINILEYNKEDYYQLFSVVFQDINLFAFSIKENVAMRSINQIDDKRVIQCLEKAGLSKKIKTLSKGIETNLLKNLDEEGVNLSGGETQKLAFARAIYKDAPFVIFDEPTSALDALAECHLYQQFDQELKNKTAVYISHRLSSTQFCDRIILFKEGKVVEDGTHNQLIKLNQEYAKMFAIQANYYLEDSEVTLNEKK